MPHIGCIVHANQLTCEHLYYSMCLYFIKDFDNLIQLEDVAGAWKQAEVCEDQYKERAYCCSYSIADFR